jgi:hypothetical protein
MATAKELLFLLGLALLAVAVLGIASQGLLIVGDVLPKNPPWSGWALVLLGAVWAFVASAVCKFIELLNA